MIYLWPVPTGIKLAYMVAWVMLIFPETVFTSTAPAILGLMVSYLGLGTRVRCWSTLSLVVWGLHEPALGLYACVLHGASLHLCPTLGLHGLVYILVHYWSIQHLWFRVYDLALFWGRIHKWGKSAKYLRILNVWMESMMLDWIVGAVSLECWGWISTCVIVCCDLPLLQLTASC